MSLFELFIIAIGLSMDAFAVAICKGLSFRKARFKNAAIVGLYFGTFQAGMPLIGYFLGTQFQDKITSTDHWVAFVLLGIIGLNMIKESRDKTCDVIDEIAADSDCQAVDDCLGFKNMIVLAIATSIDALAVGITFAFLKVNIFSAVSFIGIITFICSFLGVKLGNIFGVRYKSNAELVGGIILIGMGTKILLEHLGLIHF